MSNSSITSEPLDQHINEILISLFKEINFIDVFRNNAWMAGGFPRLIGSCNFKLNNIDPLKAITDYFFKNNGDIDIFTISKENFDNCSYEIINGRCKSNLNRNLNTSFYQNIDGYTNIFSKTFWFDWFNNTKEYNQNINKQIVRIQLVNKFFYNTIEDNLNSFDFTNCKYAISLKENSFYIHYDKDALRFDKEKKLNIAHCNSPLLAKRIIKYIKNKDLELYKSKRNSEILKEYYCKLITNNWEKVFVDNMPNTNFGLESLGINKLERLIDMPQEDLVLFIGKLSIPALEKISHGYGHYYEVIGEHDWATKLIVDKSNV